MMQQTLQKNISIDGIGLHSGADVYMRLIPAKENQGIIFKRTDVADKNSVIPAKWDNVVDTRLCTVIGNDDGVTVGTIEHLMAALRGCGIDNAVIELDGPEVPVMDGSSAAFVQAIEEAGTMTQAQPRRAIKVLKEICVERDGKKACLLPSEESSFSGKIEYQHPNIGSQAYKTKLVNGNFKHELAECRTFGFLKDVEMMRSAGLALGGSLENAIVLDDEGVMNPEGLRFNDEFIRHKLLDAVGDLYLAGSPIIGAYEGQLAGHALNNELLHALFADELAWETVDLFTESSIKDVSVPYAKTCAAVAVTA